MSNGQRPDGHADFLLYTAEDGQIRVEVFLQDENIWLTQKAIGNLFGKSKATISEHLANVFETGELREESVVRKFRTTAADGKTYNSKYYNLDAIISVGYRVNSRQATQFRIWATRTLKEFLIKGFALDDERLKQGKQIFGKDYFDELLERIREIRASERRFYQKITDLYALSSDYNKDLPETKEFFASVQNKLHWAITGKTAAEIISERADSMQPHMGLTSWRNAPRGKILPSDVSIAKNYLKQPELEHLNRIVSMYLDYAELQAVRNIPMRMQDWIEKLDAFLRFSEYEILTDAGSVSHEVAVALARREYEDYRAKQDRDYISDFDREVKRLLEDSGQT